MAQELKVFELIWARQEKEWVCAHTNIEALKTYLNITGTDMSDLEYEDEIVEVPKEKWPGMTIRNSNKGDIQTFEEYMKAATGPDIIAGTMYE
jgi:hypothetical protein